MIEWTARRGLRESLEQFAARHAASPAEARGHWRAGCLQILGFMPRLVADGGCRPSPGLAVPVYVDHGDGRGRVLLSPCDVIEDA